MRENTTQARVCASGERAHASRYRRLPRRLVVRKCAQRLPPAHGVDGVASEPAPPLSCGVGERSRRRFPRPLSCGRAPPSWGCMRVAVLGRSPIEVPFPRRYPAAPAPVRGSRPPSPPAILRAWQAATEFAGLIIQKIIQAMVVDRVLVRRIRVAVGVRMVVGAAVTVPEGVGLLFSVRLGVGSGPLLAVSVVSDLLFGHAVLLFDPPAERFSSLPARFVSPGPSFVTFGWFRPFWAPFGPVSALSGQFRPFRGVPDPPETGFDPRSEGFGPPGHP